MGALATTLQSSGNDNESPREDKQQAPLSDPPFFRLPGELRNRVYEYALTTDKTLCFIGANSGEKPKLLGPDSRHANGEYNQLKYTCRQLYQETAGLEARFNKIEIVSRRFPKAEPARIFRIFLTTSAPEKAAWFTNVTMKSSHCGHDKNKLLEPASDLLPIADFCRRNPHVNIRYIPGGFEYELYSIHHFAAAGLFIYKAVRQCNKFPSDPAYNLMKAAADRWTNAQGIARFNVPNLRIWPAVEVDVDLDDLIVSDRARKWIPDMQTWVTEGI